jgi:hypothetical protein
MAGLLKPGTRFRIKPGQESRYGKARMRIVFEIAAFKDTVMLYGETKETNRYLVKDEQFWAIESWIDIIDREKQDIFISDLI